MELSLLVETGGRLDVRWPLKPIAELKKPDYIVVEKRGPLARVSVVIKDVDGRLLNGVPISVYQRNGDYNFRARSGEVFPVPPGEYVLGSMAAGPALNVLLEAAEFEIPEYVNDDVIINLQSAQRLRMLRVVPKYETGGATSGIAVSLRHSALKQSITLFNYYPKFKPALEFYLPQGRVELRVGGGEFATSLHRFILDADITTSLDMAPLVKLR
jgi:hypothetical protein